LEYSTRTDIHHYWQGLKKRTILILACLLVGIFCSWFLAYRWIKPQYEATTSVLINQPETNSSTLYDSILANQALVNTYSDIIRSHSLVADVVRTLHLHASVGAVTRMITVDTPNQSQIIDIHVLAPSQQEATQIANQIAHSFRALSTQLMGLKDVQVVDPAINNPNATPTKPNKMLSLVAGCLAGLTVGILLALLLESVDPRIRSEADARDYFQLPILGVIGDHHKGG
jgi:capsular polysaccharide biosynthesis protein